jgi:hypothetical protein
MTPVMLFTQLNTTCQHIILMLKIDVVGVRQNVPGVQTLREKQTNPPSEN